MARGPDWLPEIEVDVALARRLIREQFPDVVAESVEHLADGWDNTVFVVDEVLAFRFPRRRIALPGVVREMALLARLGPRVTLPIPTPIYRGVPGADYPWPFFGSRLIVGRELTFVAPADRRAIATALGLFLRTLHALDGATLASEDCPVDPMDRAFPRARRDLTEGRLNALEQTSSWRRPPEVSELLDAADLLPPANDPLVLVHGDLHVRHVLAEATNAAAGVIDWGDSCLAAPVVDLSIAYACFTDASREAFWDAYGRIDAEQELRARALGISLSAALASHAAAVGDAVRLAETVAALARSVS